MTALITGGGTGIGKGIAYKYAEMGYDVAITYRESEQGANEVLKVVLDRSHKITLGIFFSSFI